MPVGPGVTFLHERTQSGRCGVKNIHLMLRYHFPETIEVGIVGNTFEDDTGSLIGEWSVHDVAVPRHPADVSRTPVDITRSIVEDVLVSDRHLDQIPTSRM